MKKTTKIIAILMISLMVFALASCGNSGGGSSKASPVGTYSLSGMSDEEGETSQEDLDMMEALGLTITLELKEDNTGTITMFGESVDITWDDKAITMDGESVEYEFDGTELSMEGDGTKLVFTLDKDE